jgi:hypothetical protein
MSQNQYQNYLDLISELRRFSLSSRYKHKLFINPKCDAEQYNRLLFILYSQKPCHLGLVYNKITFCDSQKLQNSSEVIIGIPLTSSLNGRQIYTIDQTQINNNNFSTHIQVGLGKKPVSSAQNVSILFDNNYMYVRVPFSQNNIFKCKLFVTFTVFNVPVYCEDILYSTYSSLSFYPVLYNYGTGTL